MRDLPCSATFHRAWKQSPCTQRNWRGLAPGRTLAATPVTHRPVGRAVDASEGWLLSRRTIRHLERCHRPLRRPSQAQPQHCPKERPDRVPEGNLSVEGSGDFSGVMPGAFPGFRAIHVCLLTAKKKEVDAAGQARA